MSKYFIVPGKMYENHAKTNNQFLTLLVFIKKISNIWHYGYTYNNYMYDERFNQAMPYKI